MNMFCLIFHSDTFLEVDIIPRSGLGIAQLGGFGNFETWNTFCLIFHYFETRNIFCLIFHSDTFLEVDIRTWDCSVRGFRHCGTPSSRLLLLPPICTRWRGAGKYQFSKVWKPKF